MEPNDARLERWPAILLSLLFFLPLVAHADEILYPDFYVGKVPYRNGDGYLAIAQDRLVPVRIRVESVDAGENDPHNGTSVHADGFERAWLVRGKNLRQGPIDRAVPDTVDLQPGKTRTPIALGTQHYELSYRCANAQCTLVLSHGGLAQDLASIPADLRGGYIVLGEEAGDHHVLFAGDLDRDGRLDLIANHTKRIEDWHPTLWLSSAAKPGQLVGRAADLVGEVGGC